MRWWCFADVRVGGFRESPWPLKTQQKHQVILRGGYRSQGRLYPYPHPVILDLCLGRKVRCFDMS